jgi:hypothetical protein
MTLPETPLVAQYFTVTVNQDKRRFNIPQEVKERFDWHGDFYVGLLIFGAKGDCRFHGVHQSKSGGEIYGPQFDDCFAPGERIHIIAFTPPVL